MLNEKSFKKLYCKNVKGNKTMKHDLMLREPELYFDSIHNELNNFLRDTLLVHANPLKMKKNSIWRPAIEVKQNEKEYKVRVQLPGVNKDDIEVELDNDSLHHLLSVKRATIGEEIELRNKNITYRCKITSLEPVKADILEKVDCRENNSSLGLAFCLKKGDHNE